MSWELLFASETADRAAATLLHSLWQAALLAVAAAVVCRLGRLAVTAQYLVYATALAVCATALPLTYWMIDAERRPVVAAATKAAPGESRESANGASPVGSVSVEVWATAVRQPLRPRSRPSIPDSTVRASSFAATWQRAIPWLLACYAVGVIGMLVRLALGVVGAERLRRAAIPITDGPVMRALTAARRRWPLHRAPLVARSEQVVVPALVGLLQPTILLPVSSAAGLTPHELELVLAHELAHVVRRDLWVTLFQRIVETVLFFNPAIWYLSRRTSMLREFCADEAACRETSTRAATLRVDYATALLHMAELARPSLRGKPALLALAAAGRSPSEFRRRIARLLGEPVREPLQASRSGLALVALATVALAVGVAWAEPSEKPANRAELTASGESKSEASESHGTSEKLVERLTKLLPPLTEVDRAVANARARTFGLGAVDHISMRDRSWSGPVTETFQPDDGSLASLWAARGKQVDEKMRRLADFTMTVAWSGPQLLVQSDSPVTVGAGTPPGLYTQSRYWDGAEGWLGEISPDQRRIYQYAQVDKLMEYLIPAQFPFWEGAGGRLPWQGGTVVLQEYQVAPELTRYQHEGVETIDGVECDVYAGPARSERLWIEKASGLVKATSRYYWGESLPNYVAELVAEAAGRTFRDEREYHDWLKQQPAKAQELLTAHSAAAHWHLMKPGNLTVYSDYRELQPEVEFPMRAERVVVHPNHPGEGFKYYRSEAEVTDVTEKFDIRKLAVQALPRIGDAMTDRRAEPPVDYTWPGDQAAALTTTRELRDAKVAEMKNKAEQDRLINETPISSVGDAIKILTEGPNVEPTKVWVRAIKYLADHKEETLPAVVAALDAEERDHPISKLAFALRAMGDPRAVPALIRALPKTLLPSRSDYGLLLDGQGSDHDELLRFIVAHDQGNGDDGDMFTYGRAFREVAVTLQKLSGQDFDEMELNWIHRSEAPAQLALQQEQFHRVAQRWAQWWEANWESLTDDESYSTVNLPALAQAAPPAGGQVLPAGPGVTLEDTRSGWIVQSAHESSKRCFVDLDTMREGGWPDSLPPIDEIGADSPELLAWARREGFDLMGLTFTPPGESEPLYCLKPLGMEAWKMSPSELRELKWSAAGKREYPLSQPVELMVPRRKILPPFDQAVDGDSFLYLSREGTAGVVRMTAQVPENSTPGGYSDDQFEPTGFYPGVKVTFAMLQKSDEAPEAKAPSGGIRCRQRPRLCQRRTSQSLRRRRRSWRINHRRFRN